MAIKIRTIALTLIFIILSCLIINEVKKEIMLAYQPFVKTKFVRVYDTGGY